MSAELEAAILSHELGHCHGWKQALQHLPFLPMLGAKCSRCPSQLTYARSVHQVKALHSGREGIVSKRKTSPYRSGRSPDWIKTKNPACEAVRREAEDDWGQ